MYHPMFCCLTDGHLATLSKWLQVLFVWPFAHNVCSQRSHHGLSKRSVNAPQGQDFICSSALPGPGPCFFGVAWPTLKFFYKAFFGWMLGFFLWLSEEHSLPLPHLSVFSFSLIYKTNFRGLSTLLAQEDNLMPLLCWSLLHMLKRKALYIF